MLLLVACVVRFDRAAPMARKRLRCRAVVGLHVMQSAWYRWENPGRRPGLNNFDDRVAVAI